MALDPQLKNLPGEDAGTMRRTEAREIDREAGQHLASREGKYLIFNLGRERYGLGILKVREIIGLMAIHELPNMPLFYRGVINLRGKVIPVMDMRGKFGMESVAYDARTCIIVVELSGADGSRLVGIIVDSVSEVANVREQEVEEPLKFGVAADSQCLLGMAKLSEGVTLLLDIDRLMHSEEAVALSGAF
ncbi:chemotaxis protein CheW [Thiovibrio sp. JS02]